MPVSLSLVCRDIVVLARSVISVTTSTGSSVCRIEAFLVEGPSRWGPSLRKYFFPKRFFAQKERPLGGFAGEKRL